MSTRLRLPATLLVASLGLIACGPSGASPGASTSPTAAPTATPAGIPHPTDAKELVLRFDEGGGFVPVEFLAAHVPYFSLYGDGRAVFLSTSSPVEPRPDGVATGTPIRTAVLSGRQVQDLLRFALSEGGLAAARTDYPNPLVADAPTAVFEIHADGDSKVVSIMALGMEEEPGPDTAIKTAFRKLAELLRDFDKGGSLGSSPFAPAAYRCVLNDASGVVGVPVREWPWKDLAPTDFALPADPNVLQMRTRVLSTAEATAIGIVGFEAGIAGGVFVRGPDGSLYSLVLRPLLPDESR